VVLSWWPRHRDRCTEPADGVGFWPRHGAHRDQQDLREDTEIWSRLSTDCRRRSVDPRVPPSRR